jgi:hypothetical protein
MTAVFHGEPTDAILLRIGDGLFHGPIGYDMSHRPVSFQECGGAFILYRCELAFLAHVPFSQ